MTYSDDIIRIISGLLQLGVAWYALRLSRLCKSGRAGWLLFSALALLALAYVLLPINPFRSSIHLAVRADAVMGLISMLLIAGMVHLDIRFRKQFASESADRLSHTDWEKKVGEQLEDLNKTNDELRQTASSLQTQLGEGVRNQQQNEQMSRELLNTSRQTETELRQTITELEGQIGQLKEAREKTAAEHEKELAEARQAAQAETATQFAADWLPQAVETADTLKSAQRAAGDLARSRFVILIRAAKLLNEFARDMAPLCKRNPRGMQIHQHLLQLAQQLAGEQSHLLKKTNAIDRALKNLETAARLRCDELSAKAGLPTAEEAAIAAAEAQEANAPVLVPDLPLQMLGNVTQTGTESATAEMESTSPEPSTADSDPEPAQEISAETAPAYLGGSVA